MKKIILTVIITLFGLLSCDKKVTLKGTYRCTECSFLKKLSIDEQIVDMGLFGSGSYTIKNDNLYVNWYGGVAKFKIVDENTLKSITSVEVEQRTYKKIQ